MAPKRGANNGDMAHEFAGHRVGGDGMQQPLLCSGGIAQSHSRVDYRQNKDILQETFSSLEYFW